MAVNYDSRCNPNENVQPQSVEGDPGVVMDDTRSQMYDFLRYNRTRGPTSTSARLCMPQPWNSGNTLEAQTRGDNVKSLEPQERLYMTGSHTLPSGYLKIPRHMHSGQEFRQTRYPDLVRATQERSDSPRLLLKGRLH